MIQRLSMSKQRVTFLSLLGCSPSPGLPTWNRWLKPHLNSHLSNQKLLDPSTSSYTYTIGLYIHNKLESIIIIAFWTEPMWLWLKEGYLKALKSTLLAKRKNQQKLWSPRLYLWAATIWSSRRSCSISSSASRRRSSSTSTWRVIGVKTNSWVPLFQTYPLGPFGVSRCPSLGSFQVVIAQKHAQTP